MLSLTNMCSSNLLWTEPVKHQRHQESRRSSRTSGLTGLSSAEDASTAATAAAVKATLQAISSATMGRECAQFVCLHTRGRPRACPRCCAWPEPPRCLARPPPCYTWLQVSRAPPRGPPCMAAVWSRRSTWSRVCNGIRTGVRGVTITIRDWGESTGLLFLFHNWGQFSPFT